MRSPQKGLRAGRLARLIFVLLGAALPAGAQPLPQDELDFQGRASLAIGSGARALGMGGAFLARADDATAASWNPAGLSYLRRPELCLVGVYNNFDRTQTLASFVREDNQTRGSAPDFVSAAVPFEFGAVSGAAQLSFQRVFSFDGKETRSTFTQGGEREVNFRIDGEGGFDVLALGTGVRVTRTVRMGFTVNRWLNGYRLTRVRDRPPRTTLQNTTFDLRGWNVNAGLLWSPIENLNLGLVGKTPFTSQVELARQRRDSVSGVEFQNEFASDDVRLRLPAAVGAGVSWRPRSPFTVSADYTRTFWSDARIQNFFLLPQIGEPRPPGSLFESLPYPGVDQPEQVDTEQTRLGAEYVVIGGRLKWPLRAGLFTDRQYFRAADGSVPRFLGFTVGAGVLFGPLLLDAAFVYETGNYAGADSIEVDVTLRRVFVSLIYRHQSRP